MVAPFNYKLYLVTDQLACQHQDFFHVVEAALKGGVDLVQIREKELNEPALYNKTLILKELLEKYNVPLIVNDSITVAIQAQSAGIHVGNSDISPVNIRQFWPACEILGYSLETLDQLNSENAATADYIALSPIFSTTTKRDTITEWGLEGIKQVRSMTNKPLVAIGHINSSNAKDIIQAGANCLAIVSAICSAADPERAAAEIRNEIEKAI